MKAHQLPVERGIFHTSRLDLSFNCIMTIKGLTQFKALSQLNLSGNPIQDLHFSPWPKTITILSLSSCSIGSLDFTDQFGRRSSMLSQLTFLRELSLSHNSIKRLPIHCFEKNKCIEVLDLSHNKISEDDGFYSLSGLSRAHTLLLHSNKLKNEQLTVMVLARMPELSKLSYSQNCFTYMSCSSFERKLKNALPNLKILNGDTKKPAIAVRKGSWTQETENTKKLQMSSTLAFSRVPFSEIVTGTTGEMGESKCFSARGNKQKDLIRESSLLRNEKQLLGSSRNLQYLKSLNLNAFLRTFTRSKKFSK